MPFASGAVSALRPAALAWSSILRTALSSYPMLSPALHRPRRKPRRRAGSNDLFGSQRPDFGLAQAELHQHLLRVLTEERGAPDLRDAVGHLDRIAHRQVLAACGMIDLDDGAGGAQRGLRGQLFHGQNRAARNIVLIEF